MMKYLPDNYKLIMVGRAIIESYRKVLDEAIGENKNIDAKESVQHIEVPPLLEKAHLFVSASKVEVQALSVIEALASATPVVGLSNETIDELITENNGVWLKKNTSPKNFAKAVRRVLEDEENYERLSRNARESVKEFDWDKVVKRTLEMYSQYESKTKKIDHKTTKSQVSKLVDSFPDFPGKKYLYESISDWGEMSKKRVKKIVSLRKVSKRVLLFTGLTVGLFATIYGISQVRKAAKNVRRKVSK